MKSATIRFMPVLAIMAIPIVLEPLSLRLSALLICAGLSIFLVSRGSDGPAEAGKDGPDSRSGPSASASTDATLEEQYDKGEMIHRISMQITDVVQQTEQAAVEINDRVIAIIGRARKQLKNMNDIASDLAKADEDRDDDGQRDLRSAMGSMEQETGLLADDVNGVVRSLQFQDLTKQRLDSVLSQLQQLRCDQERFPARSDTTGTVGRKEHPVS